MSTWKVGDVTIAKVIELEATGGSRFLLSHQLMYIK